MKVLEFEAKTLLAGQNLPIPQGKVAALPEEAAVMARTLGQPVVIKAQIPGGGRMRAGGIHFVDTPEEAKTAAGDLLGGDILGFRVEQVLVEEKLDIAAEVFVAATYDNQTRRASLLASLAGGIDVESTGSVTQHSFSLLITPVPDYLGREIAAELGKDEVLVSWG